MAEKDQGFSVEEFMATMKQTQMSQWKVFLTLIFTMFNDNNTYRGSEVKNVMVAMWDLAVFAAKQQYLDEFDEIVHEIVPRKDQQTKS